MENLWGGQFIQWLIQLGRTVWWTIHKWRNQPYTEKFPLLQNLRAGWASIISKDMETAEALWEVSMDLVKKWATK